MAKVNEMLAVTEEEKKAVLKHYNMNEKDLQEKVEFLVDYQIKSGLPHEDFLAEKARVCLINNKMSTERAKQSLKGYYDARTRFPAFFQDLIPGTEFYELGKKYMRTVTLPKLTPDLCRISLIKHHDPEGEAPNGFIYEVTAFMQAELRIKDTNECFLSNVLLIDMQEYSLMNLLKYTPSINSQLVNILLALKLRIKCIHIINHSSVVDKMLVLMRTFLPEKFQKRIKTHNSFESLYEHIPKEYLPKDYGGDLPSIDDLYEKWCEIIESEKEYFVHLAKIKWDLSSDDKQDYDLIGGGVEGSFKKLNID